MADDNSPIQPEDDIPHRLWYRKDLYTGAPGSSGRYIPKVDDSVFDYEPDYTLYRVRFVDGDGKSTLELVDLNTGATGVEAEDILLGAGPGTASESFRVYVNSTKLPFTLAIDPRLRSYSPTATHYKVFRGSDIGEGGEVISAWYSASGNLESENIPLEIVAQEYLNNTAIKACKVGYCTKQLADGEPVMVVFYDSVGGATGNARLLVRNTNFVRASTAEQRYVTGIRLKSPFLSLSDNRVLEYPENVTMDSVHFKGIVSYSDGSSEEYGVDGNKFSLYGMGAYIPTNEGQEQQVSLAYKLSANESSYAGLANASGVILESYTVRTVDVDGAYSLKLFGYPSWVNSVTGYRMEWWLYNLERDVYYYATPFVEMATNSAPFQPTAYGVNQEITVAIDINRVNNNYREYRHVQTITITLQRRGDEKVIPNWTVGFTGGQNPPYGQTLAAKLQFVNTNQWNLDISSGAGSTEDWLRRVYLDTKPLVVTRNGSVTPPPIPTHFNATFKGRTYEMSVDQWDDITVVANDYQQGELLKLQFFRRTANEDLQLGMSAMIVYII